MKAEELAQSKIFKSTFLQNYFAGCFFQMLPNLKKRILRLRKIILSQIILKEFRILLKF